MPTPVVRWWRWHRLTAVRVLPQTRLPAAMSFVARALKSVAVNSIKPYLSAVLKKDSVGAFLVRRSRPHPARLQRPLAAVVWAWCVRVWWLQ